MKHGGRRRRRISGRGRRRPRRRMGRQRRRALRPHRLPLERRVELPDERGRIPAETRLSFFDEGCTPDLTSAGLVHPSQQDLVDAAWGPSCVASAEVHGDGTWSGRAARCDRSTGPEAAPGRSSTWARGGGPCTASSSFATQGCGAAPGSSIRPRATGVPPSTKRGCAPTVSRARDRASPPASLARCGTCVPTHDLQSGRGGPRDFQGPRSGCAICSSHVQTRAGAAP